MRQNEKHSYRGKYNKVKQRSLGARHANTEEQLENICSSRGRTSRKDIRNVSRDNPQDGCFVNGEKRDIRNILINTYHRSNSV